MQQYINIIFIALTALGALVVLLSKNILYAALALFFTFLGIAGIYVFASADFLAITQIIVYLGGILVLTLFGIMLTNRVSSIKELISVSGNRLGGYFIGLTLFGLIAYGIHSSGFQIANTKTGESVIEPIGMNFMTDYILLFEIAGILLLVVLVGAAYLISDGKQEVGSQKIEEKSNHLNV